jgi:hypothetical protein
MKSPIVMLVAAGLLAGCGSFQPYDPVLALDIREMAGRTSEVVTDGEAGRLSLANSRQFLRGCQGQVQVWRARGKLCGLNEQESAMLDSLDEQCAALLARKRPFHGRDAVKLKATLWALQASRPYHGEVMDIPDTFAAADVPDAPDSKTNNCDNKHDQGGKDCGCRNDHR